MPSMAILHEFYRNENIHFDLVFSLRPRQGLIINQFVAHRPL
jgi:hypothetical protein